MAFPETIVEFPTMLDITVSDAPYVNSYQKAMEIGDLETAAIALSNIPDYAVKI